VISAWQKSAHFAADVDRVSAMIGEDARRILDLMASIAAMAKELASLCQTSDLARIIGSIPGFGTISTAELAGEIGDMRRFPSEQSLALDLGMAPLDHSSGQKERAKTALQVNTRTKAAMMVAVAHHAWKVAESQRYYVKKRAEGKKHNQAIRSLGRHLVRVIWSMARDNRRYEMRNEREEVFLKMT